MSSWRRVRSLFPVTRVGIHLDHAGGAPVSSRVEEAVRQVVDAAARPAADHAATMARQVERARASAARLLSAQPREVAFVEHAMRGLALVAGDVNWRRGDALVVAGAAPGPGWMRLEAEGVDARALPDDASALPLERVEEALRDPRVRLLALPSVDPETGLRAPLDAIGRLCQERGVLLCVDASFHLGCLVLDVARAGIDYLVCDGHRFLCGLPGSGLLFRSARAAGGDAPAHERFESGPANTVGIAALGAAIDLLLELGPDAIEQRVLGLVRRLAEGLDTHGIAPALAAEIPGSGILGFRRGNEAPARTALRLMSRRIRVAAGERGVRVSPHCYVEPDEIDALLDAL